VVAEDVVPGTPLPANSFQGLTGIVWDGFGRPGPNHSLLALNDASAGVVLARAGQGRP